ncbi:Histone deacetylase complex catalytic component HDA1 [Klebsormidium nitens]|uniref:Histone deacetylase complex catalytic component HDA1 n=1 Tax=Klebsormidium nitens TaxID=105231 RepID=A0A1Y1IIZ0_KLENI|nr:Histone deacetylase complex catalytic component HDA1 [Klebsormidium nitens]|eukprot:GAQ90673.1 Histone deacetylase complex catalytic component HDA1 [Klebsormidium nitens]
MGEESNHKALLHVFWHDDCLKHNNGAGFFDMPQGTLPDDFLEVKEPHPEGVDRLKNMRSVLKKGPISKHVQWHHGRTATAKQLLLFHKPDYIEKLEAAAKAADGHGDSVIMAGGTVMNPGSYDAILAAAGTTLAALDCIVQGAGKVAYALVRPPGHHAQTDRADGYCFVNNAGVAVAQARQSGFDKIAVIDIDVHHGNGTQEGFYTSPDVLTISLHMDHGSWDEETHPQQGATSERGEGSGAGSNVNIPLPFGTGDKGYDYAMQELVELVVDRFAPNLIVVPLELDGSAFDPNGRQALTMAGYKRLGERIRDLAAKHAEGAARK